MKRNSMSYKVVQVIGPAALWAAVATVPMLAITPAQAQDRDDMTHQTRQHTGTASRDTDRTHRSSTTGVHRGTSGHGTYTSHRTYSSGSTNSHGRRGATRASSTGLSRGLHRGWYKSGSGSSHRISNSYRSSRYRRATGTGRSTDRDHDRDDYHSGTRRHDTIDSTVKRHHD